MEQKNIYAFLRKRASAFLRTVPQPTLNISPSERPALAIYFRLGNHIDYPEVGDAIIIFMQEYLKYFRDASFFSSIRIIPRDADKRPNNSVLKDKNTQFYEVYGAEFLHALHNGAIPIYLSHSCYSGKK